jgi:hypothetical protein
LNLEKTKEELQQFNDGHREYETDLRFQRQRRGQAISKEMRGMAEAELDDIALDRIVVQDAVDLAKVDVKKTKSLFALEKNKD